MIFGLDVSDHRSDAASGASPTSKIMVSAVISEKVENASSASRFLIQHSALYPTLRPTFDEDIERCICDYPRATGLGVSL